MGGLSSTLLFDLYEGIVSEGYLQHFSLICMQTEKDLAPYFIFVILRSIKQIVEANTRCQ